MGMRGAQGRRSLGDDEYLYVKLVGEALETLLMATTYHFLILHPTPFNARHHWPSDGDGRLLDE